MRYLLLLLFFALQISSFSQSNLYLTIASNYSNVVEISNGEKIHDDYHHDGKYKLGLSYIVGASYLLGENKNWGFNPEIGLHSRGFNARGFITADSIYFLNSAIKLSYISFNGMFSTHYMKYISLELGTELGYQVKSDFDPLLSNKWDFGLVGGISFHIHPRMSLKFRYFHGFLSLNKYKSLFYDAGGWSQPGNTFQNRSFQMGLSYSPFK